MQVEVTKAAQEAGIRFPVFITRIAFDAYVTVPPDATGQDEAGHVRGHGHISNVLIACSNAIELLTVGGSDEPRGGSAWKVGVGTGGGWGGLEGAGVPIELKLAGAQVLQREYDCWRGLDFNNRR